MTPGHSKKKSRALQWTLLLFLQTGILLTLSCHGESTKQIGETKTEIQKIQQQLVAARHREKALQQENTLARNSETYLLISLSDFNVELKAKGRTLRAFKIKRLKVGLDKIPDTGQVLSEVKPIQKIDRPKLKPGEGEAATAEAAQQNLWGLERMPQDYDMACLDGMTLEFRGLPSEQSGTGPFNFIKTLYRRALDWYRRGNSSGRNPSQTIQLWLDENDSKLLFWSLPKQLKILVIPAVFPSDLQPSRNSVIQLPPSPVSAGYIGKTWTDLQMA